MLINYINSEYARLREFSARRERLRDISEFIECYNSGYSRVLSCIFENLVDFERVCVFLRVYRVID